MIKLITILSLIFSMDFNHSTVSQTYLILISNKFCENYVSVKKYQNK